MEACDRAILRPCIHSNPTAPTTEGDCKAAIAARIDKGWTDDVAPDAGAFIVLMHPPGARQAATAGDPCAPTWIKFTVVDPDAGRQTS